MTHEMRTCYAVTMDHLDKLAEVAPHSAACYRATLKYQIEEMQAGKTDPSYVWFALGYVQAECSADIEALS